MAKNSKPNLTNKAADFRISTIIGKETGVALMQMQWGEQTAQLTPLQARQHALAILEAADAASTETVMLDWLQNTVGMDAEHAMGAMATLRDARAKSNGQG